MRENLTSSSYGEGLETGRKPVPRQSFTRQFVFKTTKSFLNLAKEFQGRSYDSMIAHTTIVFCRYIMLALENRENKDPRTLGNLFYVCCDELQDISFTTAFQLILTLLKDNLRKYLSITEDVLQDMINNFISHLPVFLKGRLQLSSCES
ncbi:MAG: hypothetical protein WC364_13535 [Eubacteriales bacterium]